MDARTNVGAAGSGRTLAWIGVVAAVLHGAFDAVTAQFPALVPPYLRLNDAPEEFQMLSPVAVSIAVSSVSGIIAVICVAALLPAHRRPRVLAGMITGFWVFSAVLLRLVWLTTPWGTVGWTLLAGAARGAAVGSVVARLARRVSEPTA